MAERVVMDIFLTLPGGEQVVGSAVREPRHEDTWSVELYKDVFESAIEKLLEQRDVGALQLTLRRI